MKKYLQALQMIPSLLRAGWTLSEYNQRIKFTLLNRYKQSISHVYSWLKYSVSSPLVNEDDYWEQAYARAGKTRPTRDR